MDELFVYYGKKNVGSIQLTPSRHMQFRYATSWLADELAFPISLSMPLQDQPLDAETSHNFFVNLLPEAGVRQRICGKLKISPGNDFELTKAIGGDCAGALSILSAPQPIANQQKYQTITDQQLADWSVSKPDAFSDVAGHVGIRLSLAGAQDKLPVFFAGQDFALPVGNSPSTHLLKFSSPHYSHLPENEAFMLTLADAVGLPVVNISLHSTLKERVAVVERYDRDFQDGVPFRLHQEDFCQILGINPANKYEKEGGPSLATVGQVIKNHCSLPAIELQKLLQWTIFNLLTGNADAHGKNLSILFASNRRITLAPFYDLVCTRNYDNLDRHMAMAIGGETDPGQIGRRHFEAFADEMGISKKLVIDSVTQLLAKIRKTIPENIRNFQRNFGESPILERVPLKITQQMNRTMKLL